MDVVMENHRKEIDELAAELSGSKSGSHAYISHYRTALSTTEKGLTDEIRVKYRADAQRWSEEKPPPSVQRRYVHTNRSCR